MQMKTQSTTHTRDDKAVWILAILASLVLILWAHVSIGQTVDDLLLDNQPSITQAGQLFVIQFSPRGRQLDVKFAGEPAISIDPSKVIVFGRVYPAKGQAHDFKIAWMDGHFQIAEPIDLAKKIEFTINDIRTKKTETFQIDNLGPK